ncbi:MAG TPA: peptidoglycan DD-metalloendopeptidase family protein [Polyangiaceae bacterium]|nr:peptidoglycan DD-metalloendopeptidase family protein [Polyangiaceae bacterium]
MDPSVRDDGDPEPDLQLASETAALDAAPAEEFVSRERDSGSPAGESMRERLMARAQAARQEAAQEAPVQGGLDEIGRDQPRDALDAGLDALAPSPLRAPAAPLPPRGHSPLSPTLLALFGTLIGIATVLSLIALMINIDRHRGTANAMPSAAPSTSAAVAAPAESAPPMPKRIRQKVPGPWRIADVKGDPKLRVIEGKVGTDPFIKALTDAGVEQKEAFRVIAAMKGVRDFDKCGKADRFTALIERASTRLKAFEYTVGPEEIYQAREGDDGRLVGAKLDLKVERNQVTGAVVYDGHDFDASAERAGFDSGLGHVVALALQGHMSLDELERGDTLRLIGQEVTVLGEFARYTGIEAVEVHHASPKRETLRVYYFDDQALRGYYDASGKSPFEGGWRKPIPGAAVTSPFNPRRMHPILHKIMPHLGTDIGAPLGTPVGASAPGIVSYVGPGGAAGNLLKIMHDSGIETGYAHLSRYAPGIKVGDKVKRMQIIGYVGSTGRSTGPHLHFSAQRDGKFFDAETLNLDGMRVLNAEQREQFSAVVAKYNPLLDAIALPPPLPGLAADTATVAAPEGSAAPAGSAAAQDPSLAEPAAEVDEGPAQPATSGAAKAASAPGKAGNSVYLSDKELLKMQSATDEGEVSE